MQKYMGFQFQGALCWTPPLQRTSEGSGRPVVAFSWLILGCMHGRTWLIGYSESVRFRQVMSESDYVGRTLWKLVFPYCLQMDSKSSMVLLACQLNKHRRLKVWWVMAVNARCSSQTLLLLNAHLWLMSWQTTRHSTVRRKNCAQEC